MTNSSKHEDKTRQNLQSQDLWAKAVLMHDKMIRLLNVKYIVCSNALYFWCKTTWLCKTMYDYTLYCTHQYIVCIIEYKSSHAWVSCLFKHRNLQNWCEIYVQCLDFIIYSLLKFDRMSVYLNIYKVFSNHDLCV